MKRLIISAISLCLCLSLGASERMCFNNGWTFALGNAASMQADFTHGTEYFTYICKARSNDHNRGPAMPGFDDSSWQEVSLPHDWVVDLPFSGEASHSHGYKCIGWKYPDNSVGWYRKRFEAPREWEGKRVFVQFDGIFRASQVFCNGFYLGGRDDGYLGQVYDLTDYLDYGAENLLVVRCDASLEEGWFYEGAGIYRNVWLQVIPDGGIAPGGVRTQQAYDPARGEYSLTVAVERLEPSRAECPEWSGEVENALLDASGAIVASSADGELTVSGAHEWSVDDPYLYTLRTIAGGDTVCTRIGLRRAEFDADRGFLLNGEKLILKGCNLHQDHAGVGSGIPDGLWRYRLERLREFGFNAIRCSHNPATPAMLDLCDELGFLVIDENREFGSGARQLDNLRDMILRDMNHPSVVIWSIGNEEWSLEWSPKGTAIARRMCAFAHGTDPSRPCTYGNSGGRELVKGVDVFGYNYIVQNPIDEYRQAFPEKAVLGTEETSGAGTRGKYATVPEEGWMQPFNRRDSAGVMNVIERGWKFYHSREWTCGLFYWTGIDYRGEPNPMAWPATGSQFGIFDYCAFPKDEAWYLRSWWTDEPVLHVTGPSDGSVWVYSNCPEVELFQGRKSLGKKKMPADGHLEWKVASEGPFTARARAGKRRLTAVWPCVPAGTSLALSKDSLVPDGQDIVVVDIDSSEEFLTVEVSGAHIIGWGNGNPGFKETERPLDPSVCTVRPFSGKCQVIVRSVQGMSGTAGIRVVTASGEAVEATLAVS